MPNVESTAVNELVDLAQQTPLSEIDDDLFGASKARRGLFELPPAPPAPAPPAPAPPAPIASIAPTPLYLDEPVTASRPRRAAWHRIALPAAAGLVLAAGAAVIVAHVARRGAAPAIAQAKPIIVEPAPPPPVLVPTTAPAPKLVDVRLESTPPGATAMLLADGTATPLGATPVVASVDPSKRYDVVFAIDGQPSQVVHLEPSTTHELQVAFAPPTPAAPAAAPAHVAAARHTNTAKARRHHHHHASRVASAKRDNPPKLADPTF